MTPENEQLVNELHVPADATDGVTVVVLLHGRGADRTDLFGLRHAFLADWAVVAPDAPFPAAPWGYGPGRAWYRFLGGNTPEPESFSSSLAALDKLIGGLPDILGKAPGRIVLGGFSQGGTLSLAYALTHPARALSVINFSGFLADHPAVRATPETVAGARFFWGHGRSDPAIPFELAVAGRRQLQEAGADLEARDYAIGHSISQEELGDAVAWASSASDRVP